jgi:transcriptional regulator with XRE-family HTH domain
VPSTVHNSVYKDLIARLVAARTAAGLTQQDVADALGKPMSYVAKVEGLERKLDEIVFLEFWKAIGADPMSAIRAAWTAVRIGSDISCESISSLECDAPAIVQL